MSLHVPSGGWRSTLLRIPNQCYGLAFICFILAFMDPHLKVPEKMLTVSQAIPKEGIAIYLIVDQSGSMSEALVAKDAQGNRREIRKIDLLKQVTKQFIMTESSNLIGLVAFARIPHVLAPLTLDQKTLLEQVDKIDVVKTPSEDGTSMGYAIYKTAHFIAAARYFAEKEKNQVTPAYTIKNSVIVVVTDGFQDPNLLDKGNRLRTIELDEVAEFAKDQGIRLYIINIDSLMGVEQYAPQRRQLANITKKTGGDFFIVTSQRGLQEIYDKIDQLEKEALPIPEPSEKRVHYSRFSFYPFFIALGLFFFFLFICLDSTLLKKVP